MSDKNQGAYFGSFTPPLQAPIDLLLGPFKHNHAVARMYCCRCGKFFELLKGHLEAAIGMSNLLTDSSFQIENFDPAKHYILAAGCYACEPEPKPVIQRLGEPPSLKGAQT